MQGKYIKYIIVILIMSIQFSVSAQSSNPFEVVHTKKYLSSDKDSADKSININKIDQSKSDESIINKSSEEQSSLEDNNTETSQSTTSQVDIIEQSQSVNTSNNPFEVTHGENQSYKQSDSLANSSNTIGVPSVIDINKTVNSHETDDNNEIVDTIEKTDLTQSGTNSTQEIESNTRIIQDNNPFSVQRNTNRDQSSGLEQVELDPVAADHLLSDETNILKTEEKSSFLNRFNKSTDENYETTNFIFWIIFFTIFLFAILINYRRSFILKSYRGILNENYLKLIKREENNGFSPFFISLFVVFLLSIAVFIYLILLKIYKNDLGFWGYLYIFLGVLVVYVIRYIIIKLIGYIFGLEKVTEKYFFIILYYNVLLGICLLVINIFFAFGSDLIIAYSFKIGLIITVGLLFIRVVRGFLLSIQDNFIFKIQFILYLCAVEIAPTFILMKYLSGFSNSFI